MIASEDPCTSDFIIMLSSSEILSLKADSWVTKVNELFSSLFSCDLASHKVFASFSLSNTKKSSPALAAPFIPRTSIGDAGKASLIFYPKSSIIPLAFPYFSPLTK